jgi:valyl-tRNA synthetase
MSKSKGNVINPLDKTAEFGTDALRLALTIGITPGNDGALGDNKIAGYRNLCNKLWNVARFILDKAEGYSPTSPEPKALADKWILDRFSRENAAVTKAIESYRFSEAGQRVYSLLWDELADWYLEASKIETNTPVLIHCLETILKLAHPFAPFVTEVIWQNMPWQKDNLIVSNWPEPGSRHTKDATRFNEIIKLVEEIRTVTADLGVSKPTLLYASNPILDSQSKLIKSLAKLGDIKAVEKGSGLRLSAAAEFSVWLDIDAATLASYQDSVKRKRDEAGEYLKRLKQQLANPSYTKQAPADVVEQTQDRAAETELLVSKLDEQLKAFSE